MSELNEAWNVLGDAGRRWQYDQRRQSSPPENELERTLRELGNMIDYALERGDSLLEIERKLMAMGVDESMARTLIQDVLGVRRQLGRAEYRPRDESGDRPMFTSGGLASTISRLVAEIGQMRSVLSKVAWSSWLAVIAPVITFIFCGGCLPTYDIFCRDEGEREPTSERN